MAADTLTFERAMSDYLSISRNSHLYRPEEYERVEAAAWQALMDLIPDGANPFGADLQPLGA